MAVSHLRPSRRAIPFADTTWVSNKIEVIRLGTPGAGQIGPHNLPLGDYDILVSEYFSGTVRKAVGVDAVYDPTTGKVSLIKAGGKPGFTGVVSVSYLKI